MSGRFKIEHPDGREYALTSLKVFQERYEPDGFRIAKPQPNYGSGQWEAPKQADDKPDKGGKRGETA